MSDEFPSLPKSLSAEDLAKLHRATRQAYRIETLPPEARTAIERARYPTDAELAKLTE